mmetsp:Transcript_33289/g.55829  ORF Transcript_33289/g.55829 Transcript_33289/m.55829 type:complete len:269 (+) Transcript_33289:307-1113(+)|eukprot:CAMPEP_0198210260 /NCGR_PEP_ID=MMETSP1445-20131203/19994_1 /TAXON_ID=36898 /ORGANISM="Pyramimonas sp., Strain CCMP2087" /LENGTH=268 /DNA_ID=CAMNT_0043884277 /DNA_START=281 /DNA_END=1087 /DNA_ORIENTATION=-
MALFIPQDDHLAMGGAAFKQPLRSVSKKGGLALKPSLDNPSDSGKGKASVLAPRKALSNITNKAGPPASDSSESKGSSSTRKKLGDISNTAPKPSAGEVKEQLKEHIKEAQPKERVRLGTAGSLTDEQLDKCEKLGWEYAEGGIEGFAGPTGLQLEKERARDEKKALKEHIHTLGSATLRDIPHPYATDHSETDEFDVEPVPLPNPDESFFGGRFRPSAFEESARGASSDEFDALLDAALSDLLPELDTSFELDPKLQAEFLDDDTDV